MCEVRVYMELDDQREKVMEDVMRIESTEAGIVLTKLFEPPQTVQGVIREIDFLKHSVTLTREGTDL
jgi:predicted RNA-binding protein